MRYLLVLFSLVIFSLTAFADGIIVPQEGGYPNEFLKNKSTDVSVEINGLVSETVVYQEFRNEWKDTVDGVFTFPLPPGARATRLQYSVGDSLVDAVLKVQQQSTNPGTGTGGVVARINSYMGDNALSIALTNIPPYGIKGLRLSYIETLQQSIGTYQYKYPLNTGEFIKHPLDYLRINIKVNHPKTIGSYELSSHPDFIVRTENQHSIELEYLRPKVYAATDISFEYAVEDEPFGLDLFCWKPDEGDGYFTMLGMPPIDVADSSLAHNVVFLLGNSTTMQGNKIDQSKSAISLALDELNSEDSFTIISFNRVVESWKDAPVPATSANKEAARLFLDELGTGYGNRLDLGLFYALNSLQVSESLSSLLVFCDGRSPLDPFEISMLNTMHTGINFIAIGNDVDRVRLEAVAAQNYGFVSYIGRDDVLSEEMFKVFKRIHSPIIRETMISFNDPEAYAVLPQKSPAVFAGTDMLVSGRYKVPGSAFIEIGGSGKNGEVQLSFERDFLSNNEFSRKLWAKQAIDAIETEILIYGEEDALKEALIDLSLSHNIRCRYTAFIEETIVDEEDPEDMVSAPGRWKPVADQLLECYPNPFNDYIILSFEIDQKICGRDGYIRIIDLYGKTIKIIRLLDFEEGIHEIRLGADEFGDLVGGMFFVQLIVDGTSLSTKKVIKINGGL